MVSDRANNIPDMNSSLSLHPKVAGAVGGSTVSGLVWWVLTLWHITPTTFEVGFGTSVVTVVCAYLAPILKHEQDVLDGAVPPTPVKS